MNEFKVKNGLIVDGGLSTINGSLRLTGSLFDINNTTGTTGYVLSTTPNGVLWVSGGTGGGGVIPTNFDYIDFTTGYTATAKTGRVYYDTNEQALSYFPYTPNMDVTLNIGQESLIRVYNSTGVQINNGSVVHISGSTGGLPTIVLSNASDDARAEVAGVATHDIPNNSIGFITYFGIVRDVNTSAFNVGDELYLSDTINGGFTNNVIGINFSSRVCSIGWVITSDVTNGKILVSITNENKVQSLTNKQVNILLGNTISTGVFDFTGITKTSNTTFQIAPVRGWFVDNTTNPVIPHVLQVNYSGSTTGQTTPYLSTSDATYILLTSASTITLQTTFPTPQERRLNIFLGKLIHPSRTSILNINNTVDFEVSPMSALRDLWTPIKLINDGIIVSPNGDNLNINTSAGGLWGNGIGWATNQLNPNQVSIAAKSPASFFYRTQTGGTSSSVTLIDPTKYDVGGAITSMGGAGSDNASNQRVYLYPTGVINILYGQTNYPNLTAAVAGIQTETFVTYPNAQTTGVLIGIISVRNDIVADGQPLTNTNYAKFTSVSKFGELLGGTGGLSTTTLQQAYDNSTQPEILTDSTLGAVTFRRGSAAETDNVFEVQNISGVNTFAVTGQGNVSGNSFNVKTYIYDSLNTTGVTNQVLFTTPSGVRWNNIDSIVTGLTNNKVIELGSGIGSTLRVSNNNIASGNYSGVLSGTENTASGYASFIGGGLRNTSIGRLSIILGGSGNTASSNYSFIGNGVNNTSLGVESFIGGGDLNIITGNTSAIVNGTDNDIYSDFSFIGSGSGNTITPLASHSFIGGGRFNRTSGLCSFIGGGCGNTMSGTYNVIAGGRANTTSNIGSNIAGGNSNISSGGYSVVGGGRNNCASGTNSVIAGGAQNTLSGNYTLIGGGCQNRIAGSIYSYIGSGNFNTITGGTTSIIVGGSGNTISFGCYSFIGGGNFNIVSGFSASVVGGRLNTSSGDYSSIVGGCNNKNLAIYGSIINGRLNTLSSFYSTVINGRLNNVSSASSTIINGFSNTVSGNYSTIGGGLSNTVSGSRAFIGGGFRNTNSGNYSSIVGGTGNTIGSNFSSISGGQRNTTLFNNTFILGSNITTNAADTTYTQCINACGQTLLQGTSASSGCALLVRNSTPLALYTTLNTGQHLFNGTFTATANNTCGWNLNQTIRQRATDSDILYATFINPTIVSTQNNQTNKSLSVQTLFSGSSLTLTGGTNIIADFGATNVGTQLSVTDVTTGVIYGVNDISGLPIIDATSNWDVNIYDFPNTVLSKTGKTLTLGVIRNTASTVTIQSDIILNEGIGLSYRMTQVTGVTTGSSSFILYQSTINTGQTIFLTTNTLGKANNGNMDSTLGEIKFTAKRSLTGNLTQVGTFQGFVNRDNVNTNIGVDISSNNIRLIVTGNTDTYLWSSTIISQTF